MVNVIYGIIGCLHILTYMVFRRIDKRIDMDLATYNKGRIGIKVFVDTLKRNEYRNVFYFRIPLFLRLLLNLFLRRVPDCKLQCARVGGGELTYITAGVLLYWQKE